MSVSGWALESQTLFNLQVSPAHQCDAHGRLTLVARVTGNAFVIENRLPKCGRIVAHPRAQHCLTEKCEGVNVPSIEKGFRPSAILMAAKWTDEWFFVEPRLDLKFGRARHHTRKRHPALPARCPLMRAKLCTDEATTDGGLEICYTRTRLCRYEV